VIEEVLLLIATICFAYSSMSIGATITAVGLLFTVWLKSTSYYEYEDDDEQDGTD
jgi:hypothetical protein